MKTTTVTDFRQKMKEHLNEIQNDQDFLILTGPKKMNFVVLTLETFNSMEETNYLLSTAANTARLMESIADDKAGRATARDLDLGEERLSKPLAKKRILKKSMPGARKVK